MYDSPYTLSTEGTCVSYGTYVSHGTHVSKGTVVPVISPEVAAIFQGVRSLDTQVQTFSERKELHSSNKTEAAALSEASAALVEKIVLYEEQIPVPEPKHPYRGGGAAQTRS